MKMNVKLTADELMNVVDAAMDEAIDRGYDPDDEETVDDMLHIVDAALSAMGIEITEDDDTEEVDVFGVPVDYDSDFDEEDEDEDEDYDPIDEMAYVLDDGRGAISFADACYLMDSIREVLQMQGRDTADAPEIFMNICREHDIEVVDNSIDTEDAEEDEDTEEETPSNPIEALIVEKDGKRYLKEADASFLLDTMRELVYSKTEGLPEVIREKILCDIWCKVGEENRIDGVLKGE